MASIKLPKTPDKDFRIHDWNDEELQKWLEESVQVFQKGHINDNADTKTYKCERSDSDTILLRLCIMYYGKRDGYANLLQGYRTKEKNQLKPIIKLIKKHCTGDIEFNVVYVSVGTKQKDGTFASQEIPLLRLANSGKTIDVSDPGCLYESYEDYLNKNKLQQSVMIYPEGGTYAVGVVKLKARESPSCTLESTIKHVINVTVTVASVAATFLTPACMFGGPALASMAARAAAAGSYWAATLSKVAYCASKIGTVNTIIQCLNLGLTGMNIFEKLQRNEDFYAEAINILTTAISAASSKITSIYTQKYAGTFRKAVLDGKTWKEISSTISKYDKIMLFTARLVPTILSVSSLTVSFYKLLTNSRRSMLDISSFCIALFMLTNTIIQPWTLKQMFDATQDTIIGEIRNRIETPEFKDRFNQDLKNAPKDSNERAYLIKTLFRIEDIEAFYGNMTRTQSVVTFNKNGFVLNQNIEMSAEAYNQIGKSEIVVQQIIEQKLIGGPKSDNAIEKIMNEYDPTLAKEAKDYANGAMTCQQKQEFLNKLSNLNQSRKERLFDASAAYKDMPDFLKTTNEAERKLCGNKTLEEWRTARQILDRNTPNYDQKLSELNQKIAHAEAIRDERIAFQNSLKGNGTTVSNRFSAEVEKQGGQDFITKTDNFIKNTATFCNSKTERLTTYYDSAVVKHSLQHAFGVPDYKDIKINGKPVFKDLSETELTSISGYLMNPDKAKEMVNASAELLQDKQCTWQGNSSDEVGGGMKLLGNYVAKRVKGTNLKAADVLTEIATGKGVEYERVRAFFNDAKTNVEACYAKHPNCQQYRECYTAAGHYLKHDTNSKITNLQASDFEQYLVTNNNAIFQPENITVQRYSQDGTSIQTNYVYTSLDSRRYFGVGTAITDGKTTTTTTFDIK